VVTGAGDDLVELYNFSSDILTIVTGRGDDTVSIAVGGNGRPVPETTARIGVINTGSGDDDVHFGAVAAVAEAGTEFNYLTVVLGSGADCLGVAALTVNTLAVFNGGSGQDNYDDDGGNSFPADPFFVRVLFQTFEDCVVPMWV